MNTSRAALGMALTPRVDILLHWEALMDGAMLDSKQIFESWPKLNVGLTRIKDAHGCFKASKAKDSGS